MIADNRQAIACAAAAVVLIGTMRSADAAIVSVGSSGGVRAETTANGGVPDQASSSQFDISSFSATVVSTSTGSYSEYESSCDCWITHSSNADALASLLMVSDPSIGNFAASGSTSSHGGGDSPGFAYADSWARIALNVDQPYRYHLEASGTGTWLEFYFDGRLVSPGDSINTSIMTDNQTLQFSYTRDGLLDPGQYWYAKGPSVGLGVSAVGCNASCSGNGTENAFSYSLRLTPVPIPAATWLLGSGLLGLAGVARRRVERFAIPAR